MLIKRSTGEASRSKLAALAAGMSARAMPSSNNHHRIWGRPPSTGTRSVTPPRNGMLSVAPVGAPHSCFCSSKSVGTADALA